MKLGKWIFCSISTLLIGLYLICMPAYILEHAGEKPLLEMKQKKEEAYTGILRLWHIAGFKPSVGSLGNYLYSLSKRFEKRHYGVFMEVESMSPAECEERLKRGERADLYSFPLGWSDGESFVPINDFAFPELLPGLLESAEDPETAEILAAPYVLSGYVLGTNHMLLLEQNISVPEKGRSGGAAGLPLAVEEEEQTIGREWIQATAKNMSYSYGKKRMLGLSGAPIPAAEMGIESEFGSLADFQNGNAAMAFLDVRSLGEMERAGLAGKAFYMEAYPVSAYTDLVQYLGIHKDTETEKFPYIYEFLTMLYEENQQQKLSELGLFPARFDFLQTEKLPQYESEVLSSLYQLLRTPKIPNSVLYNRTKSALEIDALRALGAESGGRQSFEARMKELVREGKKE